MLFGKKARSHYLLGIDIRSHGITLISLSFIRGQFQLERLIHAPLPAGAIIEQSLHNSELVASALIELRTKIGLQNPTVATAIPGATTISKRFVIAPHKNWLEQEKAIWLQVSQQFPELISDIYLDYVKLLQVDQANVQYLVVACRKEVIDMRMTVFKIAGFTPLVVDIDYYALARVGAWLAKRKQQNNEVVACLHVDTNRVLMAVIRNEQVLFVGEEVVNNTDGEILLARIRQLLQLYQLEKKAEPKYWYLSGELAYEMKFYNLLQQQLTASLSIANPFTEMQVAASINQDWIKTEGAAYVISCGLAMRKAEL